MKLFLAGPLSCGNLKEFWKYYENLLGIGDTEKDVPFRLLPFSLSLSNSEEMKVFLAGSRERPYCIEEAMKLYLAGNYAHTEGKVSGQSPLTLPSDLTENEMKLYLAGITPEGRDTYLPSIQDSRPYILESFYYIRKQRDWYRQIQPLLKGFLLDSGAFTYMNEVTKSKPDWDRYIEEYASFINELGIELFFELDIDSIVGITEVERLRTKLEKLTGKQSIPVWHRSRGLEYWKRMVKEFDYVAIGGIVTQEIKRNEYDIFLPLLKIARESNCKVHGLGFTNMEGIKRYPFDSVDSTAWLYGNRGGFLYQFNGTDITKIEAEKGRRLKGRVAAVHNFNEWLKFQRYAETNL